MAKCWPKNMVCRSKIISMIKHIQMTQTTDLPTIQITSLQRSILSHGKHNMLQLNRIRKQIKMRNIQTPLKQLVRETRCGHRPSQPAVSKAPTHTIFQWWCLFCKPRLAKPLFKSCVLQWWIIMRFFYLKSPERTVSPKPINQAIYIKSVSQAISLFTQTQTSIYEFKFNYSQWSHVQNWRRIATFL